MSRNRSVAAASLIIGAIAAVAIAENSRAGGETKSDAAGLHAVVIDMKEIFDRCTPYQEQIARLTEELAKVKAELGLRKDELGAMKARLEASAQGSSDHQRLAEQVRTMSFVLESDHAKQKARFDGRGAELGGLLYSQVEKEIRSYASQNNIQLVLRHTRIDNPTYDRATVEQLVGREVLYHRLPDITQAILDRVNKSSFGDAEGGD